MQEPLSTIGIITISTALTALLLGYLFDRSLFNAFLLGLLTFAACSLCFLGLLLAGWPGLLIAVLLVTLLAFRVGKGLGKERGARLLPALWLGFAGSCAIGYWAAAGLGLLAITLPAWLVFWVGLFYVSQSVLPLHDKSQRLRAFRSLVTFSLGTNYPYHVLEDQQLDQRASGYAYGQLFAGPGIVLTDPARAPIIWDGIKFKRVGKPGLEFTERAETVFQLVDLRPQLRSFPVEAITKDGIRIRVLTFVFFKLQAGNQKAKLGESFPVDSKSVYTAAWEQLIESGQKHQWDETVTIMASRLLRRIISRYQCDELYEPFDPTKDPRAAITKELVNQLRKALSSGGIEIIGGGIANLDPADKRVIEERIQAWQAEWQRQVMTIVGKGEAEGYFELERARAQAHAGLFDAIQRVVEDQPLVSREALPRMVALRFVETLEEIVSSPRVHEEIPSDTGETVAYLRRVVS